MRKGVALLSLLSVLLAAVIVFRLLAGPEGMGLPDSQGAWDLRLERTARGVVVGAALALGGVLLQTLMRNPLASPDLIGPASGAGFAVMLAIFLGSAASLSGPTITAVHSGAALIGALGALAVVYALSQRRGAIEPVQLILVGVVVNILFGAGTMFLMHLMPDRGFSMSRWTIGALSDDAPRSALIVGAGLVGAVLVAGVVAAPVLDAASLNDDEATSVGVRVPALRLALFIGAGCLTATAVVLAGPVGFVGLISPHLVRVVSGPGHRVVVPGSALVGAAIIVGADATTRAVNLGSGQMPIGVLTALLGGVTFVWMARRARDQLGAR